MIGTSSSEERDQRKMRHLHSPSRTPCRAVGVSDAAGAQPTHWQRQAHLPQCLPPHPPHPRAYPLPEGKQRWPFLCLLHHPDLPGASASWTAQLARERGSKGGMSTICETQKLALRLYNSPLSEQGFFGGWAAVTHHYSYYATLLILRYSIHITHTYTNYSYYSSLLIKHILNHITHQNSYYALILILRSFSHIKLLTE